MQDFTPQLPSEATSALKWGEVFAFAKIAYAMHRAFYEDETTALAAWVNESPFYRERHEKMARAAVEEMMRQAPGL